MLFGVGFSASRPLKRQMPKFEETPQPLERMRKKSHFGKLISIGNKSLQTADSLGEGEARKSTSFGELRFQSFRGKKKARNRQKSYPVTPFLAPALPVSICEPPSHMYVHNDGTQRGKVGERV